MSGSGDHDDESYVVKLRGLPWSTTVDEILQFFNDCNIKDGKLGIHMTMSREGRPSGEAYVEMDTDDDIEKACKKDRNYMGHRYIEVFKAKRSEMEWVVKRSGLNLENAMDDGCVRLRGLPFGCSKEEIAQFFSGLEIVPNGISLPTDYTGRSTGEAYVQFVNKEVAEKALQKHKDKIGHRYIEIFRSSLSEVRAAIGPKMRPMGPGGFNQRPAPYDRGDRFGGMNRYNNMGRGSRSFKGFGDFDDGPSPWGFNSSWGGGGGGPGIRGNMGGRGGSGMNMNSGGFGSMARGGRSGGGNWNNGGGMGGGGHCIHMRGLPFRATQADIADFFRPIVPINIRLLYDNSGRASGEADVEFGSHEEAVKAMSKDKVHMQHRYIELFLNSTPGNSGFGGGNFGGMGGGGFGGGNGGGGFGGGLYFDSQEIIPFIQGDFRFNKAGSNITRFTSKELEVRALIEGQFIARRAHTEDLGFPLGKQTRILATGGASENLSILQVLADVFNAPVYIQEATNSAVLGVSYQAKLVLKGGTFQEMTSSLPDPKLVCQPFKDAASIYDPMVARYRHIIETIQKEDTIQ